MHHADLAIKSIVKVSPLHFESFYDYLRVSLLEKYDHSIVVEGLYVEHHKHVLLREYCRFSDSLKQYLLVESFPPAQLIFLNFDALLEAWLVVELSDVFDRRQNV